MIKFCSKLISCLLLMVVSGSLYAATTDVTIDHLEYRLDLDNMTATVMGPKSKSITIQDLVIPDDIVHEGNRYAVTTIGEQAFIYCRGLTGSLIIPNSVTTIGDLAFSDCSGFTGSLTIGNSVTTIGNFAFYDCSGFTGSLKIGDLVTTIGDSAFANCSGLTGSLPIGNSVTTIGDLAFCN
ncbi:MAG: leucine-rich repeat domain-containing protein, partial [Muribaculaceae bacterium]|nr:leucine-rich repeat domain-containing protein [Muribaculaceae bacterium]